jgi:hypothetical protein
MSGESLPGDGPDDRELRRRWRQQFDELPDAATDARIRAAARAPGEVSGAAWPPAGGARINRRSTRFVPLATAASVALLAVGLVRLMPREEYSAFPDARESVAPAAPPSASRSAAPAVSPATRGMTPAAPPTDATDAEQPGFVKDTPPGSSAAKSRADGPEPIAKSREKAAVRQAPVANDAPASAESRPPPAHSIASPGAAVRGPDLDARSDDAPTDTQPSPRPPRDALSEGATRSEGDTRARDVAAAQEMTSTHARSQVHSDARAALPSRLSNSVLADAATRLGLDVDLVKVISVDPITWLDGTLGCGAGVQLPLEAPVPGYVVTVHAGGRSLRYHTDQFTRFMVCERATAEP